MGRLEDLEAYVHRGPGKPENPVGERASASPSPAPRPRSTADHVFLKPQILAKPDRVSSGPNASVSRTSWRNRQHPVQQDVQETAPDTFDTDAESLADTTLSDVTGVSNRPLPQTQRGQSAHATSGTSEYRYNETFDYEHPLVGQPVYYGNPTELGGQVYDANPQFPHEPNSNLETSLVEKYRNLAEHGVPETGFISPYPSTTISAASYEDTGAHRDEGHDGENASDSSDPEYEELSEEERPDEDEDMTVQIPNSVAKQEVNGRQQRQHGEVEQGAAKQHVGQTALPDPRSNASQQPARPREPRNGASLKIAIRSPKSKFRVPSAEDARKEDEVNSRKQMLEDSTRAPLQVRHALPAETSQQTNARNGTQVSHKPPFMNQGGPQSLRNEQIASGINPRMFAPVAQQTAPSNLPQPTLDEALRANYEISGEPRGATHLTDLPQNSRSESNGSVQLDYVESQLRKMDHALLRDQSFDNNPRPPRKTLPDDMEESALTDKLDRVSQMDRSEQEAFFGVLSLQEWEDSGDWFMDQFGDLMKKLKVARRQKREIAASFENLVWERYDAVRQRRGLIDDVLTGMKQSGTVVLSQSHTPKKMRKG